ncbi:SGNH/GDSL hydrolase family protein [Peribacillus psychrosaccharolyticus]|uniref:SGNH/GDSL hydrolase family protein n=1 Tax=Peribacillus psychrosaccharolyticus TaxID=1407 RepID=A0A974NM40_PERPY|nr:SGNH/GDSL hydrolase family protein [Peribacillus psychrosaccharolyticus]MEC2056607.1 SGNH/GDSL hydrolase family protein [Peribacillus psychrosaccharolyticus]MED3745739.1 SGNH/GDSL hydrolase family protein [Peribacillus psychrosaccharolyticus]QQT00258.1 SGNH/GDSL hydrolase family protein [Peribacillus psychrosaccharolyticus]
MKSKYISLLVSLVLISACSHNRHALDSENNVPKSRLELSEKKNIPVTFFPDPVEIVSVGDSLTAGVGDSKDAGGYLPYLKESLESEPTITSVKMDNFGVKGNRSDQLLKRLDSTAIKGSIEKADAVVITIGGNDIMKVVRNHFSELKMDQFNDARKGYELRLKQIIEKVRLYNQDTHIYLVGVYNPFSQWFTGFGEFDTIMEEWNKSSERIVSEYDEAYYVNIGDIFTGTTAEVLYTEDYFHPNDLGYQLIADRIYNHLDIMSLGDALAASTKGDENVDN